MSKVTRQLYAHDPTHDPWDVKISGSEVSTGTFQETDLSGLLGIPDTRRVSLPHPTPLSAAPVPVNTLRFLARPSACRVRVQRCTHSEKLRLL